MNAADQHNTEEMLKRAKRIRFFCREIKRLLANKCIDEGLPTTYIDAFITDVTNGMINHKDEYDLNTLIVLMLNTNFFQATWERYKTRLT